MPGRGVVLLALCVVDLCFNASLEYDTFDDGASTIPTLLFAAQFFVQVGAFICLFLSLSNTYLYQVGIIEPLRRHFGLVLVLHIAYTLYTTFLGAMRMRLALEMRPSLIRAYEYQTIHLYSALSIIHKFVAVAYYRKNMAATVTLQNPALYSHETSMSYAK
uniref:Transmembrane protein 138 n=1 Tax=Rhizochromulina marina TaxID=1034831 RepID=A0A7S2SUP1_9STRA|mmetsp:Transcript_8534/g.24293  ORF Transcript_8534/g.24293 Transcript_8534/m.24293 type:complete len:161 (+) Transcript_8534:118-600(+)